MTTNLVSKLAAALEQRTDAALADLAALDEGVALAFEQAALAADVRLTAALAQLEESIADRTRRFEERLAAMATSALDAALETLGRQVDALRGDPVATRAHEPAAEPAQEPAQEPTPAIAAEAPAQEPPAREPEPVQEPVQLPDEVLGEDPWYDSTMNREKEIDELDDDGDHRGELAEPADDQAGAGTRREAALAQALAAEPAAIAGPEEDEDGNDPDDDGQEARAIPIVASADGLCERRGQGRGTRYVPCEFPRAGETYYLRTGGKPAWTPVIYAGDGPN